MRLQRAFHASVPTRRAGRQTIEQCHAILCDERSRSGGRRCPRIRHVRTACNHQFDIATLQEDKERARRPGSRW